MAFVSYWKKRRLPTSVSWTHPGQQVSVLRLLQAEEAHICGTPGSAEASVVGSHTSWSISVLAAPGAGRGPPPPAAPCPPLLLFPPGLRPSSPFLSDGFKCHLCSSNPDLLWCFFFCYAACRIVSCRKYVSPSTRVSQITMTTPPLSQSDKNKGNCM